MRNILTVAGLLVGGAMATNLDNVQPEQEANLAELEFAD